MKYIRAFLIIFGAGFIGVLLHELYHYLTLKDVEQVCMVFGNENLMYVRGVGDTSEVIGYVITVVCVVLGMWFAVYDSKK